MEIESQSTGDVSQESSSSTPNESTATNNESAASSPGGQEATPKQPDSTNTPFHEHPRFKELIEQRNQFQEQMRTMQKQISEYENRFESLKPKQADPNAELMAELKAANPQFAGIIENLLNKASAVDKMQSDWSTYTQEQQRSMVQNQLSSLHEQYKVPAEYREVYKALIKERANSDSAGVDALPTIYKAVHESMGKLLDGIKRSERETYLSGKTKDSNLPNTAPKTAAAKTNKPKGEDFSKDPEEARKQVASRVLEKIRADRSAG